MTCARLLKIRQLFDYGQVVARHEGELPRMQ
jgi:hypothetical protein